MKRKITEFWNLLVYNHLNTFSKTVKKQRVSPDKIPFIIINYNQLEHLNNLIIFLQDRQIKNIVIIDNKSTFEPLLEYYKNISKGITVELMPKNHGHMVFFENQNLQEKYGKGYYFITDADILPNKNLPKHFVQQMLKIMDKHNKKITKVGFALDLNTIPDYYPLKEKVIQWEKKFWEVKLEENIFDAQIDTTFALYKPGFPKRYKVKSYDFYNAVRIAGNYTCKHMGWYLDPKNLSEEQQYYINTSSSSNSWKFDKHGQLDSDYNY